MQVKRPRTALQLMRDIKHEQLRREMREESEQLVDEMISAYGRSLRQKPKPRIRVKALSRPV